MLFSKKPDVPPPQCRLQFKVGSWVLVDATGNAVYVVPLILLIIVLAGLVLIASGNGSWLERYDALESIDPRPPLKPPMKGG